MNSRIPMTTQEKDNPAVRRFEGRRILLRGFRESDEPLAKNTLVALGGSLVQSLQAADLMVLGPEGNSKVVDLARRKRLKVIPWADLESMEPQEPELPDQQVCHRSAVEFGTDHLRILDVRIPYKGTRPPADPQPDRFSNLCLDEPFLKASRAVALGAAHRLPTALEGSTAASKTTVVLWVAHLLGQPVFRLNLHGQTDTGELIGRYVPTRVGEDWDLDSLTAMRPWLKPECQALLDHALRDQRELSLPERAFLMAREGFRDRSWRFAEGIIPQALRTGAWVLLDELNLAEPQILERLNPVMESPPSLLLSEGDQTRWGPGGLPVHERFRMFGTLNPPTTEYTGRSVMSSAFQRSMVAVVLCGCSGRTRIHGPTTTPRLRNPTNGHHRPPPLPEQERRTRAVPVVRSAGDRCVDRSVGSIPQCFGIGVRRFDAIAEPRTSSSRALRLHPPQP